MTIHVHVTTVHVAITGRPAQNADSSRIPLQTFGAHVFSCQNNISMNGVGACVVERLLLNTVVADQCRILAVVTQ